MKVIFEPKVYLIGRQSINDAGLDQFLADENVVWKSDSDVASEIIAEVNGRLCYMSYKNPRPGGNEAYLRHILESGHGSVLEGAVWNFIVTGVSRSLTHELIRHRTGMSPSQLSQRYVDESAAEYVVPPDLQVEVRAAMKIEQEEGDIDWMFLPDELYWFPEFFAENGIADKEEFWSMANAGMDWLESVRHSHEKYVSIADYLTKKAAKCGLVKTEGRKLARQAARSVLPNATETKIALCTNARALRHIIEMRSSRFADPEIRILATRIWEVVQCEAPHIFDDYTPNTLPDGTTELTTPYRKV